MSGMSIDEQVADMIVDINSIFCVRTQTCCAAYGRP